MAGKNVTPPFKIIDSLSVSAGAVVFTSSVTSILYKDNIGLQYSIIGNPVGTIDIQVSNDYNPGLPESAGTLTSGTWTSVSQSAPNALPVSIGSGTASVAINLDLSCFAWIRTQYTHSSAAGTITGYIAAKSLG